MFDLDLMPGHLPGISVLRVTSALACAASTRSLAMTANFTGEDSRRARTIEQFQFRLRFSRFIDTASRDIAFYAGSRCWNASNQAESAAVAPDAALPAQHSPPARQRSRG